MPTVIDPTGATVRQEAVPAAFAGDVSGKTNVMFRAVFRELANPRAGTHSTLRRDEVSGGGRKPWKQKGTGRARQGSTRSPQWTHGGVVFGPKPRSYVTSLNKKERRAALHAALSDRFGSNSVTILATENFAPKKTRDLVALLFGTAKAAKAAPRVLVVYAESEQQTLGEQLVLTGRNIQALRVTHTGALDVKDVLGAAHIVLTAAAFQHISDAFAAKKASA